MKLSYRPLTINDCDRLINLLTERPYLFNGYHDPEWHEKILSRAPGWLENPLFFIPGVWFNDDLLAAIILKESSTSPSWAWGHWVTNKDCVKVMYTKEGVEIFKEADRQIFDEMEINRNLNRFMLSYRLEDKESNHLKNAGMSDRMFAWMSRNNYRVSNYKFYTDCIVEAGQEPKYEYQKELLGGKTWPFKTAIRIGMLIQR